MISEKAVRFRHPNYNPDQAQKLTSSSTSRHLSTRNISSKSMHAFLSNLANRKTDRQTRAKTFSSSFAGGKSKKLSLISNRTAITGAFKLLKCRTDQWSYSDTSDISVISAGQQQTCYVASLSILNDLQLLLLAMFICGRSNSDQLSITFLYHVICDSFPLCQSGNQITIKLHIQSMPIHHLCSSNSLAMHGAIQIYFDWLIDWFKANHSHANYIVKCRQTVPLKIMHRLLHCPTCSTNIWRNRKNKAGNEVFRGATLSVNISAQQ